MNPQNSTTPNGGLIEDIKFKLALERRFSNGMNWFYWIAGLSIVNSILYIIGADFSFFFGLGTTMVVDVFAKMVNDQLNNSREIFLLIGLVINILIAGVFILLGYLGKKRKRGAIITGLVLYALDGVILIIMQIYLSAIFHVLALIGIWLGLQALTDQAKFANSTQTKEPSKLGNDNYYNMMK